MYASKFPRACSYPDKRFYWNFYGHISEATSVTVTDGSQPVLTFELYHVPADSFEITTVTTSPDYKRILKIAGGFYEVRSVNVGDLKNPKLVKKKVLIRSTYCEATAEGL